MATTKLIVRSSNKDALATVYLRYRHGRNSDFTVPTEFLMFPEYWNNKSQSFSKRIRFTERFTPIDKDYLESNFRNLKIFVLNQINTGAFVTKETIENIIYQFHHPGLSKDSTTLFDYIQRFVEECKSGARVTHKKTLYRPATLKCMTGFKSQFEAFQRTQNKNYSFEDIDLKFYNNYVQFFNSKNYTPNTIGRHIKYLKLIMRSARDEDLHSNFETEKAYFKALREQVEKIYLTEDELQRMFDLNLKFSPVLDLARDVFLIGYYTVQRFSEFSIIREENIRFVNGEPRIIELFQKKTNEKVIIPIKSNLAILLNKYDFNIPKVYDSKLNSQIKLVGKLAGIKDKVIIEQTRGGVRESRTNLKYELIQTHTARRSGCTNMYLAGIPIIDIMKISGHKTEKEFLKYIRVTKEETAQNLANHPWFS